MTTPSKFNELNQAEEPARILLERLGWTYVPWEELAPSVAASGKYCSRTG